MQAFRGIDDLTLEFHPNVTVLIGVNGVGKSSVLDCLSILMSSLIEALTDKPSSNKVSDGLAINGNQIHISGDIITQSLVFGNPYPSGFSIHVSAKVEVRSQDIKNDSDKASSEITISSRLSELAWSFAAHKRKSDSSDPKVNFNLSELNTLSKRMRDDLGKDSQISLPLIVQYPINRGIFDVSLDLAEYRKYRQTDAYEDAFTGIQVNFNKFFQWFRNLEDIENEERRDSSIYRNRQLEAVREAIPEFLIGFSKLRVRRSPLRMTVEKQGQELIINQLSGGEKCLLAMVGDIARRLAIANPGLPNPLQGEGIVLIDEIELHLHPKWQREILPKLTQTFPNCQFIVTTHSPQVIGQVKPESIYILQSTNGEVEALRPQYSFGRDSNSILEDLMDVPERDERIKRELQEIFQLIAEGKIDHAKQKMGEVEQQIGSDEPELVGARAAIRRREVLGK